MYSTWINVIFVRQKKNLFKLTKFEILPASSRGLIDFPQLHGSQYGLVDHICPTKRGGHAHHRPGGHLHVRHHLGGHDLKKDKLEYLVGILNKRLKFRIPKGGLILRKFFHFDSNLPKMVPNHKSPKEVQDRFCAYFGTFWELPNKNQVYKGWTFNASTILVVHRWFLFYYFKIRKHCFSQKSWKDLKRLEPKVSFWPCQRNLIKNFFRIRIIFDKE